ncbi:MAG: hypothetical protein GC131_05215 [Alphaproteobacteria bacterium]|nr:hypothetical protein [Alphaproteobacteria bacterium]
MAEPPKRIRGKLSLTGDAAEQAKARLAAAAPPVNPAQTVLKALDGVMVAQGAALQDRLTVIAANIGAVAEGDWRVLDNATKAVLARAGDCPEPGKLVAGLIGIASHFTAIDRKAPALHLAQLAVVHAAAGSNDLQTASMQLVQLVGELGRARLDDVRAALTALASRAADCPNPAALATSLQVVADKMVAENKQLFAVLTYAQAAHMLPAGGVVARRVAASIETSLKGINDPAIIDVAADALRVADPAGWPKREAALWVARVDTKGKRPMQAIEPAKAVLQSDTATSQMMQAAGGVIVARSAALTPQEALRLLQMVAIRTGSKAAMRQWADRYDQLLAENPNLAAGARDSAVIRSAKAQTPGGSAFTVFLNKKFQPG